MPIESILRYIHKHPGFVYERVAWGGRKGERLEVHVRPRAGARAICSKCETKRPGYDRLPERSFTFIPLWGIAVSLLYAMRRVDCPACGVTVEKVPWANGKEHTTLVYAWFLASWAKVLSWQEVARRFRTSWDTVFRSVEAAVTWGLAQRCLDGIRAIGVDELAWKKGHKYLTLVYQLDHGCKRLLWIGKDRTKQTFQGFFDFLGEARAQSIAFIVSDMWKAFLAVVAKRASAAVHVLDRFHVEQLLHKALDTIRRQEVRALRAKGDAAVLTKTRWILLKRRDNLTRPQAGRLRELVRINLKSVRAYLLKEQFRRFWSYTSPAWAGRFLDVWTRMAMRSRLAPLKTFAKTLTPEEGRRLAGDVFNMEFRAIRAPWVKQPIPLTLAGFPVESDKQTEMLHSSLPSQAAAPASRPAQDGHSAQTQSAVIEDVGADAAERFLRLKPEQMERDVIYVPDEELASWLEPEAAPPDEQEDGDA